MSEPDWRSQLWDQLKSPFDIIIIGGGITGAGILREATQAGLKCLLVDAGDFASGTSSRSSKLVHGGFRYLKNAQLRLTISAVHERERLLRDGRGLISQLGFLLANYKGDTMPPWLFGAGLTIYDLLALKWSHRYYDAFDMHEFCPDLQVDGLVGGYRYFDAQTDDARLVFRLIREGVLSGGLALNYACVTGFLYRSNRQIAGVILEDRSGFTSGKLASVLAKVVINATGAWSDELRKKNGFQPRLRQLRGSHLVFPWQALPLSRAVTFLHPQDHRPVFAIPWEGITLFGTTDIDHDLPLSDEPRISSAELEYLLSGFHYAFPDIGNPRQEIQAVFSGIRPVLDTGKEDPSEESREHILWLENGLLTITGGKLTTFRLMSHNALKKIRHLLPTHPRLDARQPVLAAVPADLISSQPVSRRLLVRLLGRYGPDAASMLRGTADGDYNQIGSTSHVLAEIRWAAQNENVVHLEDLMLRRTRLALTLPGGARDLLSTIKPIVQTTTGWNDEHWELEKLRYLSYWDKYLAPPPKE